MTTPKQHLVRHGAHCCAKQPCGYGENARPTELLRECACKCGVGGGKGGRGVDWPMNTFGVHRLHVIGCGGWLDG